MFESKSLSSVKSIITNTLVLPSGLWETVQAEALAFLESGQPELEC